MSLRSSLIVTFALGLVGCDPGKLEDPDRFRVCLLNVEQDIFLPKCGSQSGCHSPMSPQNGLDLATAGVATRLKTAVSTSCMSRPLLTYLPEKLNENPPCGSMMPLADSLSSAEKKCVHDYLAGLADGGT